MHIIILSLVAVMFIFFTLRSLKKIADSYGPDIQNISFIGYINPFDKTIRNIYCSLSPENKGSFWSIVSNTAVAVLTFWLGFTAQFFIYDSTKSEEYKLYHFQVVDKFKPLYDNMNDSCVQHIFQVFSEALCKNNNDISQEEIIEKLNNGDFNNMEESAQEFLVKFFINEKEWDNLVHAGEKCIEASSAMSPYLDSDKSTKLLNNNCKIFIGISVYEALKDSVLCDSITFVRNTFNRLLAENAKGRVRNNGEYKNICSLAYMYYTSIIKTKSYEKNSNQNVKYLANMVIFFQSFFAVPFLENTSEIKSQFTASPGYNNTFLASLVILLISLLSGYLIFRLIIFRFFNRQNLTPGVNKLSLEIERLKNIIKEREKELNSKENDIEHIKIEISVLLSANNLLKDANESLKKEIEQIRASLRDD